MIYGQLFWAFFKIGLLGFGGGMAIIQLISDGIRQFVHMTPEQFANIVGITQVTPGPVAVNMATYVGYENAGVLGAFFATLGVVAPAFIIITVVCRTLDRHRGNRAVEGALCGVRPATLGMVAAAAITIGVPVIAAEKPLGANLAFPAGVLPQGYDVIAATICIVTVILIGKYKLNAFAVLIAMAAVGAVLGA